MEDLVAVEVTTDTGDSCRFVTWGRIQDAVDPAPLEHLIMSVASNFAVTGGPKSVASLRDATGRTRSAPVYEALFSFAQQPIPFGDRYDELRRERDQQMRLGKEIYFAGPWKHNLP